MQTRYTVRLETTEPMLGTAPLDPAIYEKWIKARAPEGKVVDDEMESIEDLDLQLEKGTTGFHREHGVPILYDFMLKGFFKEACSSLRRDKETLSKGIRAFRKIIDGMVFVFPRRMHLDIPDDLTLYMEAPGTLKLTLEEAKQAQSEGALPIIERTIRCRTAQGERVALARSEMLPAGVRLQFTLLVLGQDITQEVLEEWLTYGSLKGLCQWRNGGWGRFDYELEKLDDSAKSVRKKVTVSDTGDGQDAVV